MTKKSILVVWALLLLTVGIASAKSYRFTLAVPTNVGTHKLKTGEYEVKLQGTSAILTAPDGKSITVAVKVENGTQKYSGTMVETSGSDTASVIKAIDLDGTTTKLVISE